MGRSEGVGAEADHRGHTDIDRNVGDDFAEPIPGHVRLRAEEHQHVATVWGPARAQFDRRPRQIGVETVAQLQRWAAGAKVDERVVVEAGDRGGIAAVRHGLGGCGSGTGRIDPAGEHHDQHRFVEHRLVDQPIDRRVVDHNASRWVSAADAAASTCSLNGSSSAGSRSPSAPPR